MKLFHGSNVEVNNPQIRTALRALDFGAGFYLTSNEAQAIRWAKIVSKRRGKGKPILNIYKFNEANIATINELRFTTADTSWLDFVVSNRKELIMGSKYDLVIGPVANDATLPVIDDYMDGVYTREEAVKRLLPQNLTDQYAFLTNKALDLLTFEGSKYI